ncbi:expressed protein [Dictyostelium purpureum]|uniref:Expressed protein n=1 Tax=Dictyostelium purpureum TaxID=5786 RepID=F0ZKA2_DICPU|nr:uncharacterized protein DICPUDRAFT_97839 [Dictyostelium purpureum]EGC35624.1 expressed protein [Dictyostelium purpureum]|eukprot:XP_003287861.1 expressed protein [Dictyostelium purpureum]
MNTIKYKYLVLVLLALFSFLNVNIADDSAIKVTALTTTPATTATPTSGKCSGITASFTLSEKPSATPEVTFAGVSSDSATTVVADTTDTTGTKYTVTGIVLDEDSSITGATFKIATTTLSLDTGVTVPALKCSASTDDTAPKITAISVNKATDAADPTTVDDQKKPYCEGIVVTVTLDKLLSEIKPDSIDLVPKYSGEPSGATAGSISVRQDSMDKPVYQYTINVLAGSTLKDLSFIYQEKTTVTPITTIDFTCTEGETPTGEAPTKVTTLTTTNDFAVATKGLCSQVSIEFTLDQVATPTDLSIKSASIDTTTNAIKITQTDATKPNYVADFDVKEGTNLDDLTISYLTTELTLPTTKLTFECKKEGSADSSKDGSSSESSLIPINIVLILSSLFLYIVLFN